MPEQQLYLLHVFISSRNIKKKMRWQNFSFTSQNMKRLMKPYMGMARTACFSTFTITQGEHSYYCLCCVHVYKWASLIINH